MTGAGVEVGTAYTRSASRRADVVEAVGAVGTEWAEVERVATNDAAATTPMPEEPSGVGGGERWLSAVAVVDHVSGGAMVEHADGFDALATKEGVVVYGCDAAVGADGPAMGAVAVDGPATGAFGVGAVAAAGASNIGKSVSLEYYVNDTTRRSGHLVTH